MLAVPFQGICPIFRSDKALLKVRGMLRIIALDTGRRLGAAARGAEQNQTTEKSGKSSFIHRSFLLSEKEFTNQCAAETCRLLNQNNNQHQQEQHDQRSGQGKQRNP